FDGGPDRRAWPGARGGRAGSGAAGWQSGGRSAPWGLRPGLAGEPSAGQCGDGAGGRLAPDGPGGGLDVKVRDAAAVDVGGLTGVEAPDDGGVDDGHRPGGGCSGGLPGVPAGQDAGGPDDTAGAGQFGGRLGAGGAQQPDAALGGGRDTIAFVVA